jgi:hypothetical protein
MEVSHYLVSGIQVAGLVIGLLGFFYLSLSLFGRTRMNFFLPLLPAAASALGASVLIAIASPASAPWRVIFAAAIGFAGAYALAFIVQRQESASPGATRSRLPGALEVIILVLTGALVTTIGVPARQNILTLGVIGLGLGVLLGILSLLPPLLSARRLQYVGFMASVLAVLTQFIPPVLDLFNIPIR